MIKFVTIYKHMYLLLGLLVMQLLDSLGHLQTPLTTQAGMQLKIATVHVLEARLKIIVEHVTQTQTMIAQRIVTVIMQMAPQVVAMQL
jgi:tryptophan 2,3-dioxygenase